MLRGRPTARGVDYTKWNTYQLCKMMGWTPSQLRNELAEDIDLYLAFMQEESNAENARKPRR